MGCLNDDPASKSRQPWAGWMASAQRAMMPRCAWAWTPGLPLLLPTWGATSDQMAEAKQHADEL